MMKLKIEYVPKEQLKPYENNAKQHSNAQINQIIESIEKFGFNDPIAVWHDNIIIEGHGRLLAAMQMDYKEDIPIIRLDNLTDEQRKAYTLVHNKLTMNTGFDFDILQSELDGLADIDGLDFDMSDFGFDVDSIFNDENGAVEDDYEPDVSEEPKAKYGDIYQLGRHRLMRGDSTVQADIEKLIDNNHIQLVLTDPPYGVNVVKSKQVGGGDELHFQRRRLRQGRGKEYRELVYLYGS